MFASRQGRALKLKEMIKSNYSSIDEKRYIVCIIFPSKELKQKYNVLKLEF